MTKSETLLEEIFEKFRIEFKRLPTSSVSYKKTPDYMVAIGYKQTYWEVKELGPNEDEERISNSISSGENDIYSVNSRRVRNSIKSACRQFKSYEVTNAPCVIVLFDARPFETKDLLFYPEIKSSMLGNAEFIASKDGSIREVSRKNALFNRTSKTYVSAIVVLHEYTKNIVFLHNPNAQYSLLSTSLLTIFNHHEVARFTENGVIWESV